MSLDDYSTKELVDELLRRQKRAEEDAKALEALPELNPEVQADNSLMNCVLESVCSYFQVTPAKIQGDFRQSEIVHARWVAIYLCDKITNRSQAEIGRFFKKDHASIINALRQVHDALETDHVLSSEINELERSIARIRTREL